MKIQEVISILENIQKEKGNIEVKTCDCFGFIFNISNIFYVSIDEQKGFTYIEGESK